MQRDFLEPGGFGETLGNDVSLLRAAIEPIKALLARRAAAGMLVIHTREGHRPDLADAPPRQGRARRAEHAHRRRRPDGPHPDARRARPRHHPRALPLPGEPVIDKPGKGAFFATDLRAILQQPRHRESDRRRRDHRGLRPHDRARGQRPRLRCLVPADCCGSYFPEFHEMGLKMIKAQGGIFGWVTDSNDPVRSRHLNGEVSHDEPRQH